MLKWFKKKFDEITGRGDLLSLTVLFSRFQNILKLNNQILEKMADMNDKSGGGYVFDRQYILTSCQEMTDQVHTLIDNFNTLLRGRYNEIDFAFNKIRAQIDAELNGELVVSDTPYVLNYKEMGSSDSDVVGGKAANVAELSNQLGLLVPAGFSVSLSAYQLFMERNHINEYIADINEQLKLGLLTYSDASEKIGGKILKGDVPTRIKNKMEKNIHELKKEKGLAHMLWAVRSSALGEDSEHSFAGQFDSVLNVRSKDVYDAYKAVLASTYSFSAMIYRKEKDVRDNEIAMGVLCQQVVDASKSGVIFTLDPVNIKSECMVISAVWGLGAPIVSGEVDADEYKVGRNLPFLVSSERVAHKDRKMVASPLGESILIEMEDNLKDSPCLAVDEIKELASIAMKIEQYFKSPQEIEWAFDQNGKLYVLQARPLNIKDEISSEVCNISDLIKGREIIFENRGVVAQSGVASGKVFVVDSDDDLEDFPAGGILVAKQSSPKLASVVGRAHGIITDVGSPTGHMATIAREFRVPTLLNTKVATRILSTGEEITMDTEGKVVYQGRIEELCLYQLSEDPFEESYEYRLLKRVLKKIAPLKMVNPNSRNFKPEYCKSYHDITRFVHEKAVQSFIDIHELPGWKRNEIPSRKLDSDNLIDMSVIDVGGGIKETLEDKKILHHEDIISKPMKAFLEGLKTEGLWDKNPAPVDFKGFMSSLTRTVPAQLAAPGDIGQNLAIVSKEYCNLNIRLGYHFTLIDSYVSEHINDNYAYFRFFGGVTEQKRRDRRAALIKAILEKHDFRVQTKGDFVAGNVKKFDVQTMYKKIILLGQLVSFTRQLDVKLNSDGHISLFIKKFEEYVRRQ